MAVRLRSSVAMYNLEWKLLAAGTVDVSSEEHGMARRYSRL
jgi:hypothetical protein